MPDSFSPTVDCLSPDVDTLASALCQTAIYAKTARGHEEVSLRAFGLSPKQRRVLIMMNGKKNLAAIAGFIPMSELSETVPFLVAELFISEVKDDAAKLVEQAAKTPSAHNATQLAALAPVKQMMLAAANRHLGLLAGDLMRRIEAAGDRAALQAIAGYWHLAIRESKTGHDKAAVYLEEVRRAIAVL